MTFNAMQSANILHLRDAGPAAPVVALGSGLPATVNGRPCFYRRKRAAIARDYRDYTHPGSGEPFRLSTGTLDAAADSFRKRLAKGIRPFVLPFHVPHTADPDARDTLGYVVGLERDGDDWYADLQLLGERAADAADINEVSIYLVPEGVDADGDKYGPYLHHIALTPNPALHHLNNLNQLPIAASGASAGTAPAVSVYVLSAAGDNPMLKAETLKQLRAKFKLADTVADADVAEQAAALALKDPPADLSGQVTELSGKLKAAEQERDAANAKALALSASAPKNPDPVVLAMYQDNIAAKREAAINAGAVSADEAKLFDALTADAEGKPNALALSAAGPSRRPFGFELWDAVAKLGANGVRTGNAVIRASAAEPTAHTTNHGGGQDNAARAAELERERKEAEAWKERELKARGHAATA